MKYKVRLFYHESKPELSGKRFEVDYEVDAPDEAAAFRQAMRQFGAYRNYAFASWIRTVIDDTAQVVPEVEGRWLDAIPVDEVVGLLAGEGATPKTVIVEGLRRLEHLRNDPRVVERLFGLLETGAHAVRVACVETLRASGRPEAADRFAAQLRGETDTRVRASMVAALGERGSKGILPVLLPELAHADDRVRANAVEAIERVGDESVVPALLALSEDASSRVRANVIRAVFRLARLHQKENLEAMLAHPEPGVRASAAWCLGEIPGESTFARLVAMAGDPSPLVRRNVIRGMAKTTGDESLERLCALLAETDPECAELLAGAILACGDAAARPLLSALVDPARADAARRLLDRISAERLKAGRLFDWLALAFRRRF